jgi:DNA-directed RNA polymerase sigma subunit (sigma70/sigma32)
MERDVVCLRYGLIGGKALTCPEVAGVYGLEKEEVRRLERRAMKKLRLVADASGLGDLIAG